MLASSSGMKMRIETPRCLTALKSSNVECRPCDARMAERRRDVARRGRDLATDRAPRTKQRRNAGDRWLRPAGSAHGSHLNHLEIGFGHPAIRARPRFRHIVPACTGRDPVVRPAVGFAVKKATDNAHESPKWHGGSGIGHAWNFDKRRSVYSLSSRIAAKEAH